MQFKTLKEKIVAILVAQAAGRYRVISWAAQEQTAEEIEGPDRTVQFYYESSRFTGAQYGPVLHDITYRVELAVSAPASVDLETLGNENATIDEKIAVMENMLTSGDNVDKDMDDLIIIVYGVLMSALNLDFNMGSGKVANRWIDTIEKDQPTVNGELAAITATMVFNARVEEQIIGEEPEIIPEPVNSGTVLFNEDGLNKAGYQTKAEEV